MAKAKSVNKTKGLVLALVSIPVGVVAWLFLWQFGFIASLVAGAIAFLAMWLYKVGAGKEADRTVAVPLLGIILVGVALAFISGMAYDAWTAYIQDQDGAQGFFSAEFWDMFTSNLLTAELWSAYFIDLLISLVFAALGAGGIIKELFVPAKPKPSTKSS